jgi:hypothetical protein
VVLRASLDEHADDDAVEPRNLWHVGRGYQGRKGREGP